MATDEQGPDTPGPDDGGRPSFNERLRARYFGRRAAGETDAEAAEAESVRRKSNQMGFFGRVERPGGFDSPPEEPVELEGPLPWELGGETDRA
ncbi:hypothetical protein SCB71_02790 [Herbiconiux sp. KACC 21604]|uniref:hypothetical protein n=1 Tax=unclassified Herbiconiux TaxID=2618217 RepID=UPI0014921AA5|nr:hypothetical protein [Herbiconiux sp. SALV-R1]QJU52330.1 hypothetical protein HL652_00770 [Herbiconiux sp. SALV-R1]WPO87183.1 hypothetical protein SCB71_02790 [Herbiconiux sp. KACC 21604]